MKTYNHGDAETLFVDHMSHDCSQVNRELTEKKKRMGLANFDTGLQLSKVDKRLRKVGGGIDDNLELRAFKIGQEELVNDIHSPASSSSSDNNSPR